MNGLSWAIGFGVALALLVVIRYVVIRRRAATLTGQWSGTDGVVTVTLDVLGENHHFAGEARIEWPEGFAYGRVLGFCDYTGRFKASMTGSDAVKLTFTGRVTFLGTLEGNFVGPGANPTQLRLSRTPDLSSKVSGP